MATRTAAAPRSRTHSTRFRAIEDASGEALTLNHMGNLARSQGDIEAGRAHLGAALELRRTLGEKRGVTISTMCLGMLEVGAGELERGRELMAEALSRAEAVDDFPAMAGVQTNWGLVEERRGDLERAARLLEDARALWHVQLLRRFEGWAAIALAEIRTALGDEAGAQTRTRHGRQRARGQPGPRGRALSRDKGVAKRVQRRQVLAWPTDTPTLRRTT